MMTLKKKSSEGLLVLLTMGILFLGMGAQADSPFEGAEVSVTWEYWNGGSPGEGGSLIVATDTEEVIASDQVTPDIPTFHSSTGNDIELWAIDFWEDEISLTYISAYSDQLTHQYMYLIPVGIHFEDRWDQIPEIINVSLDDEFAPFGMNSDSVSFDENNIWLSLEGSMCHSESMGSMPSCVNPVSPTGHDNQVILLVETVPEPERVTLLLSGVIGLYSLSQRRRSRA